MKGQLFIKNLLALDSSPLENSWYHSDWLGSFLFSGRFLGISSPYRLALCPPRWAGWVLVLGSQLESLVVVKKPSVSMDLS